MKVATMAGTMMASMDLPLMALPLLVATIQLLNDNNLNKKS
jgi:hypothetical protein